MSRNLVPVLLRASVTKGRRDPIVAFGDVELVEMCIDPRLDVLRIPVEPSPMAFPKFGEPISESFRLEFTVVRRHDFQIDNQRVPLYVEDEHVPRAWWGAGAIDALYHGFGFEVPT